MTYKKIKTMTYMVKILFLISAVMLVSCGGSGRDRDTTADDVREEARSLRDIAGDYVSESFANLLADINKMRESAETNIEKARAAYDQMTEETRREFNQRIGVIESQISDLEAKIEEYRGAAQDERDKIEERVKSLKQALEKSVKTLEEELEKR